MKLAFLAFVMAMVAFIWASGAPMPDVIASHFDGSGLANGFMSRGGYLGLMTAVVTLLPLGTVWLPHRLDHSSAQGLSLPNKAYWMAPERRAASVEFLDCWFLRLGFLFVALPGYVHWLVVRANQSDPVMFDSSRLMVALVVVHVALAGMLIQLFWRFRSGPRA